MSFPSEPVEASEVPLRPLSSILTADEIARCRAIKVDVEGSEYDVARGMHTLLPALPPDAEIIVEVAPERVKSPTDVAELFGIVAAHGYHAYTLPNTYSVAAYRDPQFPAALERVADVPSVETDVVFSHTDRPELPF